MVPSVRQLGDQLEDSIECLAEAWFHRHRGVTVEQSRPHIPVVRITECVNQKTVAGSLVFDPRLVLGPAFKRNVHFVKADLFVWVVHPLAVPNQLIQPWSHLVQRVVIDVTSMWLFRVVSQVQIPLNLFKTP